MPYRRHRMNLSEQEPQPASPSYREIPLTQGYVSLVDQSDYERCAEFKWSVGIKRRPDGTIAAIWGQRHVRMNGKGRTVKLHRFILNVTDPAVEVDHRDHDGLNNRRQNIRV